ncbi:MAG: branched-chain amino acid aminotransferase [Clostridiales bacterium]|nr:branched-chain amino acid aminotransferase [Clostridiales bacterium]
MKYEFPVTPCLNPKHKPDMNNLPFGVDMADYMVVIEYTEGRGWHSGRVVPYAPITLEPAACVFHYGQEMFEGLKAYKSVNNEVVLFRPDMNAKRANSTAERICLPYMDEEMFIEAVKAGTKANIDWIPDAPNSSLYIRPFIIATEPFLGVRLSKSYLFMIIFSPVGPYYKGGLAPTKIFVEDEYTRSCQGGTGYVKTAGNYAASLKAQEKAHQLGYSQVLWLDGVTRNYVEEIGTSNAFFVIDGEVITAPTNEGTILPGITRNSVLTLLKEWGIPASERRLTIQEVFDAHKEGRLNEVFASGTAAVISPVGELRWKDDVIQINGGSIGPIAQKLYDTITGIQLGKIEDKHGWVEKVCDL